MYCMSSEPMNAPRRFQVNPRDNVAIVVNEGCLPGGAFNRFGIANSSKWPKNRLVGQMAQNAWCASSLRILRDIGHYRGRRSAWRKARFATTELVSPTPGAPPARFAPG